MRLIHECLWYSTCFWRPQITLNHNHGNQSLLSIFMLSTLDEEDFLIISGFLMIWKYNTFFFRNLTLFTPRALTLLTTLTLLTVLTKDMLQYFLQLKTILIIQFTYITLTIQYLTHEHSFYNRTRGKK